MNRKKLIGVAAVLVSLVVIGGTFAADDTIRGDRGGQVTMNTLNLSIGLGNNTSTSPSELLMPGASKEIAAGDLSVRNTGSAPVYARVSIQRRWANAAVDQSTVGNTQTNANAVDVNMLDTDAIHLNVAKGTGEYLNLTELKSGDTFGNWLVTANADDEITIYYRSPLVGGKGTGNIFDRLAIATTIDNRYRGKAVELSFQVDAVQAAVAADAMLGAWGVKPVFGADGTTIVSIVE